MPISLHFLPAIIFIWFPGTFILTYIIAVTRNDVTAIFPYISDTGTFSPESCIFGQMLNMGSVLMATAVYIRYRQIQIVVPKKTFPENVPKLNYWSMMMGFLVSLGISIVGNFQETNVFSVHVFGALLAFGVGATYLVIQTMITFKVARYTGSKQLGFIRSVLSFICCIGVILTFGYGASSLLKFTGKDPTKWTKEQGGYDDHLVSTIVEWITAVSEMAYLLTFTNEFRNVTVVDLVVAIADEPVQDDYPRRSTTKIFPSGIRTLEENRY